MTANNDAMRDPNRWLEAEPGVWVELDDDDAPELTDEDFARMRPLSAYPELLASLEAASAQGREATGRVTPPPAAEAVALHLDPDVLAYFRATGRGWQGRINAALREAMERG